MDPAPPESGWVLPSTESPPRRRSYLVGFAPLVLLVFLAIVAPTFLAPMFDTTVQTGGITLGLPIIGAIVVLTLIGVAVMHAFPSVFAALVAIVCFTSPALFLVILGPAICLITQNMLSTES